jgi:ABC-2 type transport system ATP-binding protein
MDQPVLVCEGLVRRFGDRVAVDHVGFTIAPGETYGLLGPNGSGKTTTISMVAGILAPDEGTVRVLGRPMTTSASDAKRTVGLVPQELALYEDLTARENLRFFGRLQGMGRGRLRSRIDHVLELVGLSERANDRVEEYSGGMKRRINIAIGLLHEPALLILDEPTVGVDPQSRNQVLESIHQLGGAGLSVLYTTHYMEEAERLCDRVGILDGGVMIAEGTKSELVAGVGEHDTIIVAGDLPADDLPADDQAARTAFDAFDRRLAGVAGVRSVQRTLRGLEVGADHAGTVLGPVVAAATGVGMTISGIEVREPNLEAVFLELTGRGLRDQRP